jgi:hypothetical protein
MEHPPAVPGSRPESGLSRRGALGALGAASGVLLLNEAVAQEQDPAAQVGDTASTIRITELVTHRVQSKVYVEVRTNHKVTGWGEVGSLVASALGARYFRCWFCSPSCLDALARPPHISEFCRLFVGGSP